MAPTDEKKSDSLKFFRRWHRVPSLLFLRRRGAGCRLISPSSSPLLPTRGNIYWEEEARVRAQKHFSSLSPSSPSKGNVWKTGLWLRRGVLPLSFPFFFSPHPNSGDRVMKKKNCSLCRWAGSSRLLPFFFPPFPSFPSPPLPPSPFFPDEEGFFPLLSFFFPFFKIKVRWRLGLWFGVYGLLRPTTTSFFTSLFP